MKPSQRFKDAFKLALAMLFAYGIALAMDWGHAFWAGFAVAFCGLTGVGDSLNKGLLRVVGTVFGAAVGLVLLSLFPQDRWLLLIAMSLFVAFCTYMMGGTTRWYFWFMAGLTVPIVALSGEPDGFNNFETALLRSQMTTLGIVVYSLVSVLVWPTHTGAAFKGAVRKAIGAERELFARYLATLAGGPADSGTAELRAEASQTLGSLDSRLDAAELDTDEIYEVRRDWRRLVRDLTELHKENERWRLSLDQVGGVDVPQFVTGLSKLGFELDARFAAIESILDGQVPVHLPVEVELEIQQAPRRELPLFQAAALELTVQQLAAIERNTRALLTTLQEIHNAPFDRRRGRILDAPQRRAPLDPDRLGSVLRQSTVLWLGLLLYLYLPSLPAASGIIIVATVLCMMMLLAPHLNPAAMVRPAAFAIVLGGVIHIFVMPKLSGFWELGPLIFAVIFLTVYVFYDPRNILRKYFAIAFFLVISSIDNHQQYSFLIVPNGALVMAIIIGILTVTRYFPISYRPEDRFVVLMGRFFRSCEFLMTTMGRDAGRHPSRLDRWRRAFHLNEVARIPQKLIPWARAIPPVALGKTTPAQLQALIASLQELSYRVETLVELQPESGSEAPVLELRDEVQRWRLALQGIFDGLATEPEDADPVSLRSRLDALAERLQARVEEAADSADDTTPSLAQLESTYALLGAKRGVSEATIDVSKQTRIIDWALLREERFF
jgi:uncharacterized membrane protein YccC